VTGTQIILWPQRSENEICGWQGYGLRKHLTSPKVPNHEIAGAHH